MYWVVSKSKVLTPTTARIWSAVVHNKVDSGKTSYSLGLSVVDCDEGTLKHEAYYAYDLKGEVISSDPQMNLPSSQPPPQSAGELLVTTVCDVIKLKPSSTK